MTDYAARQRDFRDVGIGAGTRPRRALAKLRGTRVCHSKPRQRVRAFNCRLRGTGSRSG